MEVTGEQCPDLSGFLSLQEIVVSGSIRGRITVHRDQAEWAGPKCKKQRREFDSCRALLGGLTSKSPLVYAESRNL